MRVLTELAPGVRVAMAPRPGWCWSNAALLSGDGEGLLFDATMTLASGAALWDAVRPHARKVRLVYSHCNVDHVWGAAAMPAAVEVVATADTASELAVETPVPRLQALQVTTDDPYFRRHFGSFDLTGLPDEPRLPDRTFTGRLETSVGGREVELLQLGPAHTRGDCVVHVPDAGVVFAGDVLFFGDHPVSWSQGSLSGWLRALRTLLDTGASTFVPGHGPVSGREEVAGLLAYLEDVAAYASEAAQRGVPAAEAAAEYGPAGSWEQPERLASVVQSAYQEVGVGGRLPQVEMLQLIARAERVRSRTPVCREVPPPRGAAAGG